MGGGPAVEAAAPKKAKQGEEGRRKTRLLSAEEERLIRNLVR
jgi:hypothetical protein